MTTYNAQFACIPTTTREDGDFVYRSGKFFEIDKTFTDMNGLEFGVTQEEAQNAASSFTRQPLGTNHAPNPLDGLFGSVEKLWIDGNDIMAEFAIPKWLHEGTEGKELPISSEWDVETKMPGTAHFVFTPALQDAAIKAAFAAEDAGRVKFAWTDEARAAAQAARHGHPGGAQTIGHGATPTNAMHNGKLTYTGSLESGSHVEVLGQGSTDMHVRVSHHGVEHEISGEHIGPRTGEDHKMGPASFTPAWQKGGPQRKAEIDASVAKEREYKAKGLRTRFSQHQADPAIQGANMPHPLVTKWNSWRQGRKAAGVSDDNLPPELTDADIPIAQFGADQTAMFASLQAVNVSLRARFAKQDAETFIDGLIRTGQILPYEKSVIVAQFAQAEADDAKLAGTVKFSAFDSEKKALVEKEGTRVEQIKAMLSMRPSNGMTSELVGTAKDLSESDFKALFAKPSELTPEQKQKQIDDQVNAERRKHGLPIPS